VAVCAMVSLGVLSACAGKPADQAAAAPAPGAVAAASPGAPAAGAVPAAAGAAQTAAGEVLETFDASNYTYVRVKTASGDIWAATATFKVAVGDRVIVPLEMPMENFHSQTLKRDFPLIYFTSRIGREGEAAPDVPAMMPGHASMGGSAAGSGTMPGAKVIQVTEPIQPAPGGATVASVWANRKSLAGKTVTVRGKVVKFNGGIMGRNWIHIQDGTGVAADGTNDLTVTADATAKVGDVITVTGTVAVDKDFTAGYTYAVMIEGATLVVR
jgi:hypothetical protein